MKLNDENFNKAVQAITAFSSTTTLSFNVPINDNYLNVYPIVIHKAAPGLIKALVTLGFNVGVCDKGTYIDKI